MTRPPYAYDEDEETWYRIEETSRSGSGDLVVKKKTEVTDESEVDADWLPNRLVKSGDLEVVR